MEEVYMCGCVLGLALGDVVIGYLAAVKDKCVSSSKMREGLFKKAGSISLMLCAVTIGHFGMHIGIDAVICTAIAASVCSMLGVMELTSIVENICRLNPDLPVAKVFNMFGLGDADGEQVQD